MIIATRTTLVSAGTERMLVEFGKAGLISKARQQPERVGQVLSKMRTDGVLPTIDAVRSKLDQPLPLGYCNVGVVMETGKGVTGFQKGDRVASNGGHAEVVGVGRNLVASIPDNVSDEAAAFTVVGAIALHGIRLANPTLGETVAVVGLGLVGLLAVQLLHAQGCRVIGIDLDPAKVALAERFGATGVCPSRGEDVLARADTFSRGRGIDAVIITASTSSNEPVQQAAKMSRKRGRIVLVGVTGLELSRADFYEKELSFQVSCSYGPGRYDLNYEEKGQDYPIGFVRWTEQRNFEAVLDMMAAGKIDVAPLITHRFPFAAAPDAYGILVSKTPHLAILLEYELRAEAGETLVMLAHPSGASTPAGSIGEPRVSFVGAGNYASRVLVPAFVKAGASLQMISSSGGTSASQIGRKYGFKSATTELDRVFSDTESNAVAIATRHDSHAELVCRALTAGKAVFVEKPLALTLDELDRVQEVHDSLEAEGKRPVVCVGFNRRFAPQIETMRTLLGTSDQPKSVIVTVNAGPIPPQHWTQDPLAGGGRIIGEACHFVDLIRSLVGAPIKGSIAASIPRNDGVPPDTATFTLHLADGSIGTVHYFANGSQTFPKERVEVFCGGKILQLDNFRRLVGFGWRGFSRSTLWRQDKGQVQCASAFVKAVKDRQAPVPFAELAEISRVSIEVANALATGQAR
ncbi:bi-domain-containing oxidoreductase [Devosia limi]|uniref:bi-domain-containing oxidoreductase n=1 Tax=Devosia limi TaxID=288995 RepID=UPI001FCDAFCC|nr:bi-domain-containing oxidoreductase [Devosia limi]